MSAYVGRCLNQQRLDLMSCGSSQQWNLLRPRDEAEKQGIAFAPRFPLAAGPLTDADGPLGAPVSDHGASPSQLALAWLLKRSPEMVPIPGTSRVDHLEPNVAASGIELTEEEFRAIDVATAGT